MAHVQFADLRSRPTEFLDFTSVTLDEFQLLIPDQRTHLNRTGRFCMLSWLECKKYTFCTPHQNHTEQT